MICPRDTQNHTDVYDTFSPILCRCMQITGKEGEELIVSGAWLIRGQSIQPMVDANDDANW